MPYSPLRALEAGLWRRLADPAEARRPTAVVTGGSAGIGRAIAARLVSAGHDVMLVARDRARLDNAATALGGGPGAVTTLALDLTRTDAPERIGEALAGGGRYCDLLVNSAARGLSGPIDAQDPRDLRSLVEVNVGALTALCRHMLPDMRRRRRGAIINLASIGGMVPGPNQAAYYASKAYVLSLSEALASEAASDGVRVLAVAPGPVATEFHRTMGSQASLYLALLPVQRPETVARYAVLGLLLGARLVVPGIVQPLLALTLRLIPHRLSVPLIGWLLKLRGGGAGDAPDR